MYMDMDDDYIISHTPLLVLVRKDASKQDQYLFLFILSLPKRQSRSTLFLVHCRQGSSFNSLDELG